MEYKYAKYQRVAVTWFSIVIIMSFTNSILVIKYRLYGGEDGSFAYGFPLLAIGISLMVYSFYLMSRYYRKQYQYLRKNHPEIWRRFYSYNPFSWRLLSRGKYVHGIDEKLSQIELELKSNSSLMAGVFLFIPVIWILNLVLTAMSS